MLGIKLRYKGGKNYFSVIIHIFILFKYMNTKSWIDSNEITLFF